MSMNGCSSRKERGKKMRKFVGLLVGLSVYLMAAGEVIATPSTNIWNPSTDIQAVGVYHLGIDDYFYFFFPFFL